MARYSNYLSQTGKVITEEFTRDAQDIITIVESDPYQIIALFDEFSLFPPLMLLPEIYFYLYHKSNTYHMKFMFACIGLFHTYW